jgi:hypothetical protein
MASNGIPVGSFLSIDTTQLQGLIDTLRGAGYRTVGPRVADGAIVYADLASTEQLPIGYIDRQDGGLYRLEKSAGAGRFDYVVGPHSLKNFLFPPRETLLESVRSNGTWEMTTPEIDPTPLALIGVRSCDLHALAVQDKVFLGGPYVDRGYKARREKLFLVAVNCRRAAATCFCHSMNTGPAVNQPFDLALTELEGQFIVEIGSSAGAAVMADIEWVPAPAQVVDAAKAIPAALKQTMHNRDGVPYSQQPEPRQRFMDNTDIHDLLLSNL